MINLLPNNRWGKHEIQYSVEEVNSPAGYEVVIAGPLTIRNISETRSFTAMKQ